MLADFPGAGPHGTGPCDRHRDDAPDDRQDDNQVAPVRQGTWLGLSACLPLPSRKGKATRPHDAADHEAGSYQRSVGLRHQRADEEAHQDDQGAMTRSCDECPTYVVDGGANRVSPVEVEHKADGAT